MTSPSPGRRGWCQWSFRFAEIERAQSATTVLWKRVAPGGSHPIAWVTLAEEEEIASLQMGLCQDDPISTFDFPEPHFL